MSIHNYRLAHASGPNITDDRRIGISMHFMPPDTRQIVGDWDTATLVRGTDPYGHFEDAIRPQGDFDAAAVAQHQRATDELGKVLFTGGHNAPTSSDGPHQQATPGAVLVLDVSPAAFQTWRSTLRRTKLRFLPPGIKLRHVVAGSALKRGGRFSRKLSTPSLASGSEPQ